MYDIMKSPGGSYSCLSTLLLSATVSVLFFNVANAQTWPGGGTGVCGPYSSAVTIPVSSQADFAQRPNYGLQTVILVVQNDITLTNQSIIFNQAFSCTVLTSVSNQTITITNNNITALWITNAHNVFVYSIKFATTYANYYTAFNIATNSSCKLALGCTCTQFATVVGFTNEIGKAGNCPTIAVHFTIGFQLARATVFGRVDVISSNYTLIDNSRLSNDFRDIQGPVRHTKSGDDVLLLTGMNFLQNNDIGPGYIGVKVNFGIRGLVIRNNYVHDWGWAAISCGEYITLSMDCAMVTIAYNLLKNFGPQQPDSSAIYLTLRWVNPGLILVCNQIHGANYILYMDNSASGITGYGFIGVDLVGPAFKFNQVGKYNFIRGAIIVRTQSTGGYISCLTSTGYNCGTSTGQAYMSKLRTIYNTPLWQQTFPNHFNICPNNVSFTSIKGINCNPPSDIPGIPFLSAPETGNCSGLPYENLLELAIVQPNTTTATTPRLANASFPIYASSCLSVSGVLAAAPYFNDMRTLLYSSIAEMGFIDPANNNFGLLPTSKLYKFNKDWRSCPLDKIGPKFVDFSLYLSNYNIPPTTACPAWNSTLQLNIT